MSQVLCSFLQVIQSLPPLAHIVIFAVASQTENPFEHPLDTAVLTLDAWRERFITLYVFSI